MNEKKSDLKFQLLGVAGFTGLLLFIFREFIFDANLLQLNSDQIQSLGVRYLRDGFFLPQWDESRLGGLPTIDAMFGDAYHPLVFLQNIMDPARAIGFKFILCIWIAFVSGMVYFTRLSGKSLVGIFLGLLFALNPQFFSHVYPGHDGKMMVMAVIPLGLYAIHIYLMDKKLWGLPLFSLTLIWMLLSSHLQMVYFFLWGAGLYSLYLNFANKEVPLKRKVIKQMMLALSLTAALAVSSVQIIPPYVYTKTHSVRGTDDKTNIGHAVSWSLHPEEISSLLLPEFIGSLPKVKDTVVAGKTYQIPKQQYWGHNAFKLNSDAPGTALLFFGFLGIVWGFRKKWNEVYFWSAALGVMLAYISGAHTPFFQIFYELVPGVKNFRGPSMLLFWFAPALGILASFYFKESKEDDNLKTPVTFFAGALILLATLRMFWGTASSGLTTLVMIALTLLVNGAWASNELGEKFHPTQSISLFFQKFKELNKLKFVLLNIPLLAGFFISLSGEKTVMQIPYKDYFKPLDETLMAGTSTQVWLSILMMGIIVGAYLLSRDKRLPLGTTLALVAVAGLIELVPLNQNFVQNIKRSDYIQPNNPYIKAIKQQMPDSLNDKRLLVLSQNTALKGNILGLWGLRGANGFHDNELARYREFRGGQNYSNLLEKNQILNNPFIDLLNIGYLIWDQGGQTRVQKIPSSFERTHLFYQAQSTAKEKIIPTLKENFDYRNVALVENDFKLTQSYRPLQEKTPFAISPEEELAKALLDSTQQGLELPPEPTPVNRGSSRVIANPTDDEVVVEVDAVQNAVLMVSGNYHPFWKVEIDGTPGNVIPLFGNFQGVEVPAGKHKVRFYYQSDTIEASKKFVYLGLLLVAILLGLGILPQPIRKALL